MKIQAFLLYFSIVILIPDCFVFAENSRDPVTLDAVVVTAEKTEESFQTGDVDKGMTSGFVSEIRRDQFEGKMEDLSEVIEKEAGIQVRRSGGLGSFSTVSLRGASSDQVMIYLDGILLNDASGGGIDLSNISLSDVESVDIYRGITPINFGKASIGGAVNINTLRAKKSFNASLTSGYGSFNTRQFSGFISHKPDKKDYVLSFDYRDSDNDFDILNDNQTTWNTADDKWQKRNNAQFDQKNLFARFGYDLTDDKRIILNHQYFSKDQGLPAWNNSEIDTSLDTEKNTTTLKFIADDISPYHLNMSILLDYMQKQEEYDDSGGHVGLGEQHSKYNNDKYGASFFLEHMLDGNVLNFKLDIHHESYDVEEFLSKRNPNDSTRDTFSFGIQDSLNLFQERLIISPGLRYTIIDDQLESGISVYGLPLEGRSRDEDYINPQIGVKFRLLNWLTLKANAAEYTREPSFFELFGDRGFFVGNEELDAEKGINFDAGFEINRQISSRWIQRFSFKAAYFVSDVDDLITPTFDSRGIGKYVNISSSLIRGVETGIDLDFLGCFRLTANGTWQEPEIESQDLYSREEKLPGRFETSCRWRIEATHKGLKIYYENIIQQDMYYDTANLLKAEDRNESNIGVSWLFKSFLFQFEARNIGDDLYEDFNGYPLPGRSFYFSVKYSI